jgi:hypothetical protein
VITVQLATTTLYTVTGTDANGCTNSMIYQAKVNTCNGLTELSGGNLLSVYPNPSNGDITVTATSDIDLQLVNSVGQLIRTFQLNGNNHYTLQVSDLAGGVYFVMGKNSQGTVNEKVIINK